MLYRLRMGWLLGSRFLLLTHTGRRTGQTRQTVLEVVGYDRSIPEVVVIAAWGERAQWVRNLEASPAISVQIGRTRWPAPEHHILDAERTAEVIATYRREHPFTARLIGKLLGWPLDMTDPAYEPFVRTLCAVAFRPAEIGDSRSDVPLFHEVGLSIALNATPDAQAAATHRLDTDDLRDLLPLLQPAGK